MTPLRREALSETACLAWSAGLVGLASLLAAAVNLQLFQDGASYLVEVIVSGSAVRHGRSAVGLIQLPSIVSLKALTRLGVDPFVKMAVERVVFCLNYAAVPLIALVLSWLVAGHRRRELFVWSALIILFVNLVNFSWVSELLIAMQLACPLMLACFIRPQSVWTWMLAGLLGALMFSLHPLASVMLLALAVGTIWAGWGAPARQRAALALGALASIAAGLRVAVSLKGMGDYERSMTQPANAVEYLFITPLPNMFFLVCALAIGFNQLRRPSSQSAHVRYTDTGVALAATAVLIAHFFFGVRNFPLKTGLAVLAAAILILLAAADARQPVAPVERAHRLRLVVVLAACFAAVVAVKSGMWHATLTRVEHLVASAERGCLDRATDSLRWLDRRPFRIVNSWALPSLVLVRQVGAPAKFLLAEGDCERLRDTGRMQVDPWANLPLRILRPFTARPGPER